jgi:cytidyltransferase-like protein
MISGECEVLVAGCFSIIHAGHVELFNFASQLSSTNKIHIAINGDNYLKKKHGDQAVPLIHRVYVLKHLVMVEHVHVFHEDNPSNIITKLRPKYYVKGPDYADKELIEQSALDSVSSKLVIHRAEKIGNSRQLLDSLPNESLAPKSVVVLQEPEDSICYELPSLF